MPPKKKTKPPKKPKTAKAGRPATKGESKTKEVTAIAVESKMDTSLAPAAVKGHGEIDEDLWRNVTGELLVAYGRHAIREHIEVGLIVLKHFFGGKIEHFFKWGNGHATYQRLLTDRAYDLSPGRLRYSVLIAHNAKLIAQHLGKDDDVTEYLSISAHKKLTTLTRRYPELVGSAALHIYNESLPQLQLSDYIDDLRAESGHGTKRGEKRGRKAHTDFVKGLSGMIAAMGKVIYGRAGAVEKLQLSEGLGGCPVQTSMETLEGCNEGKIEELRLGMQTLDQMTKDLKLLQRDFKATLDAHDKQKKAEAGAEELASD